MLSILEGVSVTTAKMICCTEVHPAYGQLVFDGITDRISRITQHQDYLAETNTAVLTQTGPLLKGREGRAYKRRAG